VSAAGQLGGQEPGGPACIASLCRGNQLRLARRMRAYTRVRPYIRIGLGLGPCLLALVVAYGVGGM
jgi:hypothetical protein